MAIPKNIKILLPWSLLDQPGMESRAEQLSAELKAEVSLGHPLYGLDAKAVASRIDRDDVLFELEGAPNYLAVVHLTWHREEDPRWPSVQFFKDWEHWANEDMVPAHNDR